MIKNTTGQKVGAQMITAADGTAFTSAVTVSVTVDAGTQATGSVGSGACVHEGNGYHTYAPAQAETNGDLVAFTFTGTGAVPQTVQIYTQVAAQTGDSFARLGAPAGASVSADIAAIEAQTDDIGVAGAGLTAVPWNADWDAEMQSEVDDALGVTLADSIPADGTRPSVKQALYMIVQFLMERSVSGTTCTVKKADGSTTLLTLTLGDATSPTSVTRAT